ncbi:MAG TPA: hypothetical protein VF911_11685, partial [Thermoanaerobaculia bacterium]
RRSTGKKTTPKMKNEALARLVASHGTRTLRINHFEDLLSRHSVMFLSSAPAVLRNAGLT